METVDGIVDYAYPMMMAQKELKNTHAAVLRKDFDAALEHARAALAETKLMQNALKEMKDLYP